MILATPLVPFASLIVLGGTITVQSQPGEGTAFMVVLTLVILERR
jgi:chemotaxis protein histidine kinase CheA